MEIKVYEGHDLEQLIQKAKEELGENIKILYYEVEEEKSWLPLKKKKKRYKLFVEELPEENSSSSFEEALSKETITSTATIDLDKVVEKIEKVIDKKLENIMVSTSMNSSTSLDFFETGFPIEDLKEFTGEAVDLIKLLISKEVEPDVAKMVVKEACGLDMETNKMDLSAPTFKEALTKGILKYVKFTGPLKVEKNKLKVVTFVGPTGVGKTTNLFKIASELVINQNLRVGAISTDTFKVGAIQQARAYANILNIPFYAITDSKNLRKTLLDMPDLDVILVDTVGRSHYDYWRLGEIKEILSGGSDWMETALVISCNTKNKEALEIVNRYRTFFPINYLFFTKIDETSDPGILLNLPIKTGIPVSYISTGQRVPEDLRVLNASKIAEYLLGE